MIHSNPNPKMTNGEILEFHHKLNRLMRGELTAKEKYFVSEKKKNMERVTQMVLSKNNGKNPILEY